MTSDTIIHFSIYFIAVSANDCQIIVSDDNEVAITAQLTDITTPYSIESVLSCRLVIGWAFEECDRHSSGGKLPNKQKIMILDAILNRRNV